MQAPARCAHSQQGLGLGVEVAGAEASLATPDLDEALFFRAGEEMRGIGRGARWLFLKGHERLTRAQRKRLNSLLAYNGVLARGYQIKEELRHVLRSKTRKVMAKGLDRIGRRT